MVRALLCVVILCASACGRADVLAPTDAAERIVSLDYCSDQYVLQLADRDDIVAVSKDALQPYSFMREAAVGLPRTLARTEDVLALKPTMVVYAHGGDEVRYFYERLGIGVVQIPWAGTLDGLRSALLEVANALGQEARGEVTIADFDARIEAISAEVQTREQQPNVLYLTPGGVTAGPQTFIGELIAASGLANFERRAGWHELPLEQLAGEQPDQLAASFYESFSSEPNPWSAARHAIVQRLLADDEPIALEGAWTACGGWFAINAVEALVNGPSR